MQCYSQERIDLICSEVVQRLATPGVGQKRGSDYISGTVILSPLALQVVHLQRYIMNNPDRLDEATLQRVQQKWFDG